MTQTSQGKDRKAVTRQYRYDAFGRRTHASCADRKLHWAYNIHGQITEHHQDSHCTTYGYGPGARLEQIQLADGTTVHYHYDPHGRWHTLSVNGDTLIERAFDSQNRETTRTAGSNTQSQLHDRYGCLIKRKWQGQQNATRRYRWDAENRLEATEDSLIGSTHYQRDSQGQLTQENDTEYHYDLGGNRLPDGGQIQQDRLTRTGQDKRSYDPLGAEVRISGHTTEHRTFDAEDQLTEFRRPEIHITYGYDALGRRAWRKTEAGTTTYLWHNDVLLGEQSPGGHWQWYLRDPQTDEPLITLIDDQPYHYELDHRMMPLRLWDQDGQKVWEGNADAWGKCHPETLEGNIHQPLRLPGQFEDELTGIVQNRFREYSPETGRYLTPDPLGLRGGLNAYRYTKNPLDFVDPLGLEFEAVITPANAGTGEDAPVLGNLEPMQEVSVPESQLSQQRLHETMGLDTVVIGPNGHGETIGALYSKVYDPEGSQLPGVDNQSVEAFNDAYRQAERISEYRAEGYEMAAQDVALGMAVGPAVGIVGGAARKAAAPLIGKAKGSLRRTDAPASSSNLSLLHTRGNKPLPAERSLTRVEYRELSSESRARASIESVGGHGHARHGAHTTLTQQKTRVQTKVAPDGGKAPTPRATTFDSSRAELEAVRRAEAAFNKNNVANPYPTTITLPNGKVKPNTVPIVVGGRKGGYGSGVEVIRDVNGKPLAGRPVQPTGQDMNAKVIFRYNPSTGQWDKITQYPTN